MPTSVEEAVASGEKAKVITTDDQKYKFKRLENENNRFIGITRLGSFTARKLAGMPAEIDGKHLEIDLSRLEIEEIKLRNKTTSHLLTGVTIIASVAATLYTIFLISFASASSDWAIGDN